MSSDGFTLVFNGEIYNHVELRDQLIGLGHRFTTVCDTEVVLRAFIQWDTACIEKLRGMFAFAVWGNPVSDLFSPATAWESNRCTTPAADEKSTSARR